MKYSEVLLIRTHVWEPIIIIYRGSDSLIRIISYPDSQLVNEGVRISEGPLYWVNGTYLGADAVLLGLDWGLDGALHVMYEE